MPPSTPPRKLPAGLSQQLQSSCGSVSTVNTSPGSTDDATSPASTAPSSLGASPVQPRSKHDRLNHNKIFCTALSQEHTATNGRLDSPSPISDASDNESSQAKPQDHSINDSSPVGSDTSHTSHDVHLLQDVFLPRCTPRFYSYQPASPTIFDEVPSLDPSIPTTFGPFPSPHTLEDLHKLAYMGRRVHIEPCLQCQLKRLPCPITYKSLTHRDFGPLIPNSNAKSTATAPRSALANPRFPACLRCIRAGEADCCIVQRNATQIEKDAVDDMATTLAGTAMIETGVMLFPTDRDVQNPRLWARKLELREALLHAERERERHTIFAPVRRTKTEHDEFMVEKIRRREERDRILLSGRGRLEVLLPTELWGERWAGGKERGEDACVERMRELVLETHRKAEAESVVWF